MMKLFSQLMMLPLSALVYSMEMFVRTVQGIQKIADQAMDAMVSGIAQVPDDALGHGSSDLTNDATVGGIPRASGTAPASQSDLKDDTTALVTSSAGGEGAVTTHQEERKMSDTNLSDDMLKLVRYKILFVKRDYEVAFPEKEELVSDNMTETSYTAWKIAEFIQHLKRTEVPEKWRDKNYPRKYTDEERESKRGVYINDLPEADKKYLRVYFQVLDRYVREKFKYEERHLEVLEQIRDKMPPASPATE